MPRSSGTVVENNLAKGLITEATGLNFPEGACTETWNNVHESVGRTTRRKGFDYETNHLAHTVTRSSSAISEFVWQAVSGIGSKQLVVIQVHNTLYFYDVNDTESLGQGKETFTVDLTLFKPTGAPDPSTAACQFAFGRGDLYVTHPTLNPFRVVWTEATNTIAATAISLLTRDLEGVDDGLAYDTRPSTLSDSHKYNLYNQGWYDTVRKSDGTEPVALDQWDAAETNFPSNSDQWWWFKDASGYFTTGDKEKYATGNSPAPKGHYIFNPFLTTRSSVAGIGTVTETTSGYWRPSATAFYAGRVWYAGVNHTSYSAKIYFSQIIERDNQVGYCYQHNDPVSEMAADLLPSDGGVIEISEIGTIYKLFARQDSLLVFASNGVWSIGGSEGIGFRANDYSIQKISSIGAASASSFVDVHGTPLWWNLDGIYTFSSDPISGGGISSLSEKTIQTFFRTIPSANIAYVKGEFNPVKNVVRFLYRSSTATTTENRYNYDRVLNLDLTSQAFYPWSIDTTTIKINGLIYVAKPSSEGKIYYITTVFNSGVSYDLRFAVNETETYLDWSGVSDYESYCIAGYKLAGEGNKQFQTNYMTVYLENISIDSSLQIQGVWDFARNDTRKRWSIPQQAYRYEPVADFSTTYRKLKIRGRGNVFQVRFYSETGKPYSLLGWSILVTGNSGV